MVLPVLGLLAAAGAMAGAGRFGADWLQRRSEDQRREARGARFGEALDLSVDPETGFTDYSLLGQQLGRGGDMDQGLGLMSNERRFGQQQELASTLWDRKVQMLGMEEQSALRRQSHAAGLRAAAQPAPTPPGLTDLPAGLQSVAVRGLGSIRSSIAMAGELSKAEELVRSPQFWADGETRGDDKRFGGIMTTLALQEARLANGGQEPNDSTVQQFFELYSVDPRSFQFTGGRAEAMGAMEAARARLMRYGEQSAQEIVDLAVATNNPGLLQMVPIEDMRRAAAGPTRLTAEEQAAREGITIIDQRGGPPLPAGANDPPRRGNPPRRGQ